MRIQRQRGSRALFRRQRAVDVCRKARNCRAQRADVLIPRRPGAKSTSHHARARVPARAQVKEQRGRREYYGAGGQGILCERASAGCGCSRIRVIG